MRLIETLLLTFVFIYLAQLLITVLVLVALVLFLACVWKRPREALILGLAVLAVALISKPIGLAVVAAIVLGIIAWRLVIRFRQRRPMLRLTYRPDE